MPEPVRPSATDVMRDRITRLGILSFALKRQTETFRHLLVPRQPVTLRELCGRVQAQQCDWWHREWTRLVEDLHRAVSRLRPRAW